MLIVAAVREELGDLFGQAVGVGPVAAAAGTAALVARHRPDAVVLVGSAGRYASGPPIGCAIVADRLGYASGAAALGRAYVPRAPAPLRAESRLASRAALPSADVLTTDAITTDAELSAHFGATWAVEHLEAYAVAAACAAAGVPFAAVLGIANDVGPDAHAQWRAHRAAAENAARIGVARICA
jgi:nucleoside phosphorylase